MMKGKASSAGQIAEIVTNMHGWEATRPELIDDAMWNEVYNTYIEDKHHLGITDFIKKENVAALQEVTAVMLEATRKGMWKASDAQISKLADIHTDLTKQFGVSSSHFSSENKKLQDYISKKASPANAQAYQQQLAQSYQGSQAQANTQDAKVLKKEETTAGSPQEKVSLSALWIGGIVLLAFVGLIIFIRKRRR